MPDFSYEKNAPLPVAGIDEAGRGPLAGSVVAAAVVFTDLAADLPLLDALNDSKKLTAKKREALFEEMISLAATETPPLYIGIGEAEAKEIDEINILQATFAAMCRAVENLPTLPASALIDGNKIPPGLPCPADAIVKGDGKSLSIAAASIIAKVTRDRQMLSLGKEFPAYGFEKHMGYGTKVHMAALEKHGPTPHHRHSFAPVRKAAEKLDL